MVSAKVLPTKMVEITIDRLAERLDKILLLRPPFLVISSKCSLSVEIKAISIPEKNAENNREIIIETMSEDSIYFDASFFLRKVYQKNSPKVSINSQYISTKLPKATW